MSMAVAEVGKNQVVPGGRVSSGDITRLVKNILVYEYVVLAFGGRVRLSCQSVVPLMMLEQFSVE